MQRSTLQTRINEAKELSHDESRRQILRSIREEIQPIIDQMNEAIGQKAGMIYADPSESTYFDDDENPDSDTIISYENSFTDETVYLNTTSLEDTRGLVQIRNLIAKLKLSEAYDRAQRLDTAVREYIPVEVWEFFRS